VSVRGDTGFFYRLRWTLGAWLLYRVGCHIPLPGLDPAALSQFASVADAAFERVSIFALGVIPLFTVRMLIELGKTLAPGFARWEAADARHALLLRHLGFGAALLLAGAQALAIADQLERVTGLVATPGVEFRLGVVASLVGATAFLSWLADRMMACGLGDGFLLLLVAPALADLPWRMLAMVDLWREGGLPAGAAALAAVFPLVSVALLVAARGAGEAFRDIWTPMLGTVLAGYAMLPAALLIDRSLTAIVLPRYGLGGAVHLVALIVLMALLAWRRDGLRGDSAGGPARALAAVWIIVCAGAELITGVAGLPATAGGVWLIVIVVAALSWRDAAVAGKAA
jgi:SecY